MKRCSKCGEVKELSEFAKRKSRHDGRAEYCKPCKSEQDRKRYSANPEKVREQARKRRADNPEKVREQARKCYRKCYADNPEKAREQARKWRAANPEKVREQVSRRRARKNNATVPWANRSSIRTLYAKAKEFSELTDEKWHVDHIVPLNHPLVSGLHCEANLQLLAASVNLEKGNRYWPDMP